MAAQFSGCLWMAALWLCLGHLTLEQSEVYYPRTELESISGELIFGAMKTSRL